MDIVKEIAKKRHEYIRQYMKAPAYLYIGSHISHDLQVYLRSIELFAPQDKLFYEQTEVSIMGMRIMEVNNEADHFNVA